MVRFDDDRYIARRDVTMLFPRVHLKDSGGSVICTARADVARLRRRITVSGGIDNTDTILIITGREMIGCTMTYDVADGASWEILGSVRRAGFLSTDRVRWRLCDGDGREVARIRLAKAPSVLSSALRGLFPRTWEVVVDGVDRVTARFRERWVASGITVDVEFFSREGDLLDRRLVVAGLMLLLFVR